MKTNYTVSAKDLAELLAIADAIPDDSWRVADWILDTIGVPPESAHDWSSFKADEDVREFDDEGFLMFCRDTWHSMHCAGVHVPHTIGLSKQTTSAPSTFTIGTSDATVFTLAAGERGFIQNLDDAPLAVKLGASASTCTTNSSGELSASALAGTVGLGSGAVVACTRPDVQRRTDEDSDA